MAQLLMLLRHMNLLCSLAQPTLLLAEAYDAAVRCSLSSSGSLASSAMLLVLGLLEFFFSMKPRMNVALMISAAPMTDPAVGACTEHSDCEWKSSNQSDLNL